MIIQAIPPSSQAAKRSRRKTPHPALERNIFRAMSGELLHHLVGNVVIAPDGLDIVIIVERIDQL